MKHILEILNNEIARREKDAQLFYKQYNELRKDYNDLVKENEILRNDLFELSKEHFKKQK
jgi:hypothetical protein